MFLGPYPSPQVQSSQFISVLVGPIWPMPWWGCNWHPNHTVIMGLDPYGAGTFKPGCIQIHSVGLPEKTNCIHTHIYIYRILTGSRCCLRQSWQMAIERDVEDFCRRVGQTKLHVSAVIDLVPAKFKKNRVTELLVVFKPHSYRYPLVI